MMRWYETVFVVMFLLLIATTLVDRMAESRVWREARGEVSRELRAQVVRETEKCTVAMPCHIRSVGITVYPGGVVRFHK
jgi:hypothetical protein